MSENTTADPEAAEDEEETDEQPAIEDEEMADFSAVADEIEQEAGEDQETAEDVDDADNDDDSAEMGLETDGPDISIGDVYCNGLGMLAAIGRTQYGTAERDRSALVDEYGDMARDLQIDEYVDQWVTEHGGMDEMTPGQAIILSTLLFGGMVAMDDPEMLENVAGEVGAGD